MAEVRVKTLVVIERGSITSAAGQIAQGEVDEEYIAAWKGLVFCTVDH